MEKLLEGDEQLDRELTPERAFAPAMGSLLLHGGLLASIALYIAVAGLFRPTIWGSPGKGGIMNATLASSVPLPTHEQPNKNVLATETPSTAPALPNQKEQQLQQLNAIPIPGRKVKPKKQTAHKTPQHVPTPEQPNKARYGEQSGSIMQRSMQTPGMSGPTTIQNGDFGTMYPWYVQQIESRIEQNWYKSEVNPATPKGAQAFISFTINSDGTAGAPRLAQSSGSSTLDNSCLQAIERVSSFPPLPGGYRSLNVTHDCQY